MTRTLTRWMVTALGAVILMVPPAAGQERLRPRPKGEPIFFHWMNPKNPVDQRILETWSKVKEQKASAAEMLDLGTLLYKRGFPRDAIKIYHRTAKRYPNLAEPWFLAGLIEHEEWHLKAARHDYKRCLKILTGNGWCNFYMGLVEEQLNHPFDAMHYYDRAFRFDPDLANPKVNPEVLKSKLQLGAFVRHLNQQQFAGNMPLEWYGHGQAFKSGPKASSRRRSVLERSTGVVRRPRRLPRTKTGTARSRTAGSGKAASVGTKPPARSEKFKPRFSVTTTPPKPTPTLNPNRLPWGTAWRPSKKTRKAVPPKATPTPKPVHTKPTPIPPKK